MTPFIAGIQHQYIDDGVEDWTVACGWAWVKCIGFSPNLARLRQRMPDTKFIYRPVLDETRPPSQAVADEVVRDCEAHPGFDVYEGINEGKILWEYADAANAMEANIADRLKAKGMDYIAVCFPTGNPPSYYDPAPYDGPGGLWENGLHAYMEHYRVAVETAKGLNCHAYHKPGEGNDPRFHEYRWQMFPDWARRRGIYVTETGWDGGGAGKGFRAYTDLPPFLASAREMHNVAAQGGCKAWVLFGGAMKKPWGTFALYGVDGVLAPQEQRDAVVRWCRALREEHSQQGDTMPYEYIFAFKEIADAYGRDVVGDPLEAQDENDYDAFKNVLIPTTKGFMYYDSSVNKAYFIPGLTLPKA